MSQATGKAERPHVLIPNHPPEIIPHATSQLASSIAPAALTARGSTAHFNVSFDSALGANGPVLADGVLLTCEQDFASLQALFGGLTPGGLPFNVNIAPGSNGASHATCTATGVRCDAFGGTDIDLERMLVVAEADEVFMANHRPAWDCGASNGEGLSRILSAELYPNSQSGFVSAPSWLNGGRPDFVDSTDPTDTNFVSIGCSTLFLNYLRYQLRHPWPQIIAAGASKLASTYKSLTGINDGGFSPFATLLQERFPSGTTAGLGSDNPFPINPFALQTGTPITQADAANFDFAVGDFNRDGVPDLYCLKKTNTGTGKLEVHVLNGANNFQSFLLQTGTPITQADAANFVFAVADFNRDGLPDLYCFKKTNTGTGKLEVHVLSGASHYQTFLLQTGTPITQADAAANFDFVVGDFNRDGIPDLYCLKKRNTGTGKLEVHVLSGASHYQTFLLQTGTPITQADAANFAFAAGDYNRDRSSDLYCLKRTNTGTRNLEVHILSGTSHFQSFLLQTGTPITQADAATNFLFAAGDFNRDGLPDVYCLKHSNTGTGKLEVHVLNGGAGYDNGSTFHTFLLHTGTPITQPDAAANFVFAVGDFNRDCTPDIYCLKKTNTGTGKLEVHILNGSKSYQSFLLQTGTPITQADAAANFEFALGDFNGDGTPDLFCIKRSNTGTRTLEVHVLSGASNYQTFLLQTGTPITQADAANFEFAIGDLNRDGRPDLYCLKRSNTGTGKLEVHVLNGASNYQSFLMQKGTPISQADAAANFVFGVGAANFGGIADLYCLKKTNTGTGALEVHILAGSQQYQSFKTQTGTILDEADAANFNFAIGDFNKDAVPDVYCLKKMNTGTGDLEVHVLNGLM